MEQLEFDFLQTRENYSINDFIVFSGNQEAFYFLNRENNDIVGVFFLIGERKSGKTYLANIWKNNVNAKFLDLNIFKLNSEKFNLKLLSIIENYDNYILEDVDFTKIEEEKIFHLMNIISLKNCNLLITTNININRYKFNLIDLKSRINSSVKIKIGKLNEEIKYMLFLKLFSDKKIILKLQVMKYMFKFTPDNYYELYNFVDKIINFSKENKNKITIPFFKKIVAKL